MAQVSGTFSTYDSNRLREEFADAIYMISPEETPALSLFAREKIVSKHPEWSTDTLATPTSTNQQIEGNQFSYTAITATTRVGNYTEIALKAYLITRSDEIVSKAGPKSELGRERRKKGTEIKQDMELGILANKASVVGTDTAARVTGGFAAWITTNDSRGASGADGGFSSGTVTAATNGTQRALTRSILDTCILNTYNSGGSPTVFMVSPYLKTVFSSFMQGANTTVINSNVRGSEQATIYAAADTYRSDFGVIDVMPNRQLARGGSSHTRNAYLIDLDKVAVGMLDDIHEERPGQDSDGEKRVLLSEYALIMKNEAAHSVAADLYGYSSAA